MKPNSRPQLSKHTVLQLVSSRIDMGDYPLALLGVRGYYKRTMGNPGANDIGIYDDAIFICSSTESFSYNANTDPSRHQTSIATLKTGIWLYQIGIHGLSRPPAQRHQALVQAGEVEVDRYGRQDDKGWFGINIHKGGYHSTSSLGCQTVHPDQWPEFITKVRSQLALHHQKVLPYILIEEGELP